MRLPDCHMCGCDLFEQTSGCVCRCHHALNKLLEMNHGDREATRRELEEEFNHDDPMPGPFKIPGVGVGIPIKISDLIKLIGNNNPNQELKIGTASGTADPETMSPANLIDHQVYVGIQTGALKNGFILDKGARAELEQVLAHIKKEERMAMCIGYLAGYNRGFRFGKVHQE